MKATLTGVTGFIGINLKRYLLNKGWSVSSIARGMSQDEMAEHLTKFAPDVVIHLASLFIAEHQSQDVESLVSSNLLFATQLLEAMKRAGVRSLINTGTSWQHFQDGDSNPVCLYAATKSAFEEILKYYVCAESFRAITLKIFDTYGPGDTRAKLIPKLIENLQVLKPLELSPGEQELDLVHIDDVVRAYEGLAESVGQLPAGQQLEFALRSGRSLSLREVVAAVERAGGVQFQIKWGARAYRRREVMKPWAGGETPPNWQAKISFEDGLKTLI